MILLALDRCNAIKKAAQGCQNKFLSIWIYKNLTHLGSATVKCRGMGVKPPYDFIYIYFSPYKVDPKPLQPLQAVITVTTVIYYVK